MKLFGLKKLDWYLIRKFLGTFFFSISLLIVIVIIFDVSEKIDDFIERGAPLKAIIFDYYLNFIPYFINLFSPLFTFIAVIFFTSRLAMNTEIIAMLSGGISFNRLLLPYFVSALILVIMSFFLSNFIIPSANKVKYEFELDYIRSLNGYMERDIHVQTAPDTYVYVEMFTNEKKFGNNFTFEKVGANGINYKLSANFIKWDSIKNIWHLENVFIRRIDGLHETIEKRLAMDTVFYNLKASDFARFYINVETMNFAELREFIKREKLKGNDEILYYEVEKYKRIVDPISLFIFTLIGVSLSARKVRGGMGFHLGAGLAISFIYIFLMQITTTFSIYSNLPPALGVWVPNIIFGLIGIYLLKTAPK